jgi:hypothetical protein
MIQYFLETSGVIPSDKAVYCLMRIDEFDGLPQELHQVIGNNFSEERIRCISGVCVRFIGAMRIHIACLLDIYTSLLE